MIAPVGADVPQSAPTTSNMDLAAKSELEEGRRKPFGAMGKYQHPLKYLKTEKLFHAWENSNFTQKNTAISNKKARKIKQKNPFYYTVEYDITIAYYYIMGGVYPYGETSNGLVNNFLLGG